jgi:hypothetical protein
LILQAITAGREECDLKPLKHLLTLAEAFYRQGLDTVLCLRAARHPDGQRDFRFVESEPLSTSYGEDL